MFYFDVNNPNAKKQQHTTNNYMSLIIKQYAQLNFSFSYRKMSFIIIIIMIKTLLIQVPVENLEHFFSQNLPWKWI